MGYFDITYQKLDNGREGEWRAYDILLKEEREVSERDRKPLWDGALWQGIKAELDRLIIHKETYELKYQSSEGPATEYLKKLCLEESFSIRSVLPSKIPDRGWGYVALGRDEYQEWKKLFKSHTWFTKRCHSYTVSFDLGQSPWANPLVWAAAHRYNKKPSYDDIERQVKRDVQGLLGEIFICKLFNYNEEEFWDDFCHYIGRGDNGWDIDLIGKGGLWYRIDSKTYLKGRKSHNLGGLQDNNYYKPKVPDVIIAPIEAEWLRADRVLNLSVRDLIDAESYWTTSQEPILNEYRAVKGMTQSGQWSRYCYRSDFAKEPAKHKGADIYARWGLPLMVPSAIPAEYLGEDYAKALYPSLDEIFP